MQPFTFRKFASYTLAGTVAMGFAGFVCGYVGPILLSPDATAGPLLGIFITGPLGAIAGALMGSGAAVARLRPATFTILAAVCTSIVAGVTLYAALPDDRVDRHDHRCFDTRMQPSRHACRWSDCGVDQMERSSGSAARPGWKEDVASMLQRDRGVVLTMFVNRQRDVFRQRKPWNRDVLRASDWQERGRMEVFFDRSTQGSCSSYPLGRGAFYSPEWEASDASPSDIPSSFLGLTVLRDCTGGVSGVRARERPAS